jgi:uncharacterized phage-associated protein
MARFNFDTQKAIQATLYILSKLGGEADYHKVFKILYFAEQKHLIKYGRPVTSDEYQAMQFGPVPSYLYDIFKAVERGKAPFFDAKQYQQFFKVSRYGATPYVSGIASPDIEQLAETEIEVLDQSINENKDLTFKQLIDKSHDDAWSAAFNQSDVEIPYVEIARAGGADPDMLKYILIHIENDAAELM